jgi:hydroxymethylglutaryl-CoA reductase (NADPH)
MSSSTNKANKSLNILSTFQNVDLLIENIKNKEKAGEKSDRMPVEFGVSEISVNERLSFLKEETMQPLTFLSGKERFSDLKQLQGNIENYIGMTMMPTGVIGPLRVLGSSAKGDFFVPLATTEGALVASYHRGAKACYLAGGATSVCLVEGVQRSPVFKFKNLGDLGLFITWILPRFEEFKLITERTSRYAKLIELKPNIEGNHLILVFEFHTGDASGQNMVTICTDAICKYIIENAPIKPVFWAIEGNYSGDKKATALSFTNVRGKKVVAEIEIPEKIVNEVLKTTPEAMFEYWRSSTIGIIQSGAIGAQGHFANGLTALFIATGQDAACVAEAATGITRMEQNKDGSLYACVTLPNLIVGTIGGGTSLPTQRECLELMGCSGVGHSRKFAEICTAMLLAGELSIAAALSAGHFSGAHKKFGRKNDTESKA